MQKNRQQVDLGQQSSSAASGEGWLDQSAQRVKSSQTKARRIPSFEGKSIFLLDVLEAGPGDPASGRVTSASVRASQPERILSLTARFCRSFAVSVTTLLLLTACGDLLSSTPGPVAVSRSDDTVVIVDQTGKRWDVGHGRTYGLSPSKYQFGLGPFAIAPIQNPQMLGPDDPGYPDPRQTFRMMGVALNGSVRAYPLGIMSRHEVANEVFGDAHVSVAY